MKKTLTTFFLLAVLVTGCTAIREIGERKSLPRKIFVGAEKVGCANNERNNICYQVKEKITDEWSLYKGEIMGFQYEPGYIYELMVSEDTNARSHGDAPDVQWVLMERINKVPVQMEASENGWLDIEWTLTQFGKPDTLISALGDDYPTVIFRKDGMITGFSGCNRFNGNYSVAGDQLRVSNLGAAKGMCPSFDGMLEQEQTVFYVFQQAGRFDLAEDRLSIFSAGEDQILIFGKKQP
ncbi:MAG: META domain-containing protein [Leptolinea sp.]|nr:META domain-containing protein [Leptolinea sp.]